jgi:hypothetical protein
MAAKRRFPVVQPIEIEKEGMTKLLAALVATTFALTAYAQGPATATTATSNPAAGSTAPKGSAGVTAPISGTEAPKATAVAPTTASKKANAKASKKSKKKPKKKPAETQPAN